MLGTRIERCDECRFFRPGFYDYCTNCETGKLLISARIRYTVPTWCPLEDAPEDAPKAVPA